MLGDGIYVASGYTARKAMENIDDFLRHADAKVISQELSTVYDERVKEVVVTISVIYKKNSEFDHER
jgi:hypothetical protein